MAQDSALDDSLDVPGVLGSAITRVLLVQDLEIGGLVEDQSLNLDGLCNFDSHHPKQEACLLFASFTIKQCTTVFNFI